jgi:aspartyl protease family protein
MATGRMTWNFRQSGSPYFKGVLLLLGLWSGWAGATEVSLVGIMGGKAILSVDGAPPRTLSTGQEYGGVKVVSVQNDGATVMIDGKRRALRIGQNLAGTAPGNRDASVVLVADARGHFQTTGLINGRSVRFLVDTGASMISLGARDAKRLGVNLENAPQGMSQTANGVTMVYRVKLNTVRVGDIEFHNVDGVVHSQDMPMALLGMSFLNRVNMRREGDTMILKKRF